jgi:hypothetical protein
MKFGHRVLLIALASPLVIAASVIACWTASAIAASWQSDAFYAIAESAPRAAVVSALGQPDVVRACGNNLWWGDDSQYRGVNDGRCVTEERYEYFLTAYGVGYSADGRVVSKYRYFSE